MNTKRRNISSLDVNVIKENVLETLCSGLGPIVGEIVERAPVGDSAADRLRYGLRYMGSRNARAFMIYLWYNNYNAECDYFNHIVPYIRTIQR